MSKVFKKVKKVLRKAVPIVSAVLAPFTGGASLAIGSAISGLLGQEKPKALPPPEEVAPAQAAPFTPERPEEIARPSALSEFAGFSPEQERSALATQGVNIGLGGEEDAYYRNLLQRSLIGEGNQVTQQENFLNPIESQYFSRQGMDTSNIMNFLKAIRG